MKKIFLFVLVFSMLKIGFIGAKVESKSSSNDVKLVSIDSLKLMKLSKAGKKLGNEIKNELEEFQGFIKDAQKELIDFQGTISKQAKILSREALLEKGEALAKMKKKAERDLVDKEDSLKLSIQRRQVVLRNKQMTVAKKVFDDKKWCMMIDSNTPGVLFVSNAIDITDQVLKIVDKDYDSGLAKSIVEKEKNKSSLSSAKKVKKG
ncbi:OmpH family outer membrane protein [Candidatus Babeliales bacterium]|nr:OmpH family outer membrane protein [Candidatus Babeliales bacterium]